MGPKIRNLLLNPTTRRRILVAVVIYWVLIVIAALIIRPYTHQAPCVVCGRVDTRPRQTLYQYREGVIPQVRDITLWYCQRHYKSAPEVVTSLPTRFDTVWGRFRIVTITGFISLLAFFFVLILLELPIGWFLLHPIIVILAFGLGGITSNFTLTLFIVLTIVLPTIMYFVWHQWIFERKKWK